jgi:putative membrane protein
MRRFFNLFILVSAFYWIACNRSPGENNTDESMRKFSITTVEEANKKKPKELSEFMVGAFIESLTEIELSKLALNNTSDARIKEFAQNTLADYSLFKKELSELAEERTITLPIVMDKAHQKPFIDLKEIKDSTQFDRKFVDLMSKNLANNIELHEDAAKDLQDTEIRSFISRSLLKIRRHAKIAAELR